MERNRASYPEVRAWWRCVECGYVCESIEQPPCFGPHTARHDRSWMQAVDGPDEPMPVEAYDGAEQGIEPSIDLMLLHIGVGLPRAQGLAERKAAFKIVRGMERQLAELGTDGAKSLFHSLQETRRQLAEAREAHQAAIDSVALLTGIAECALDRDGHGLNVAWVEKVVAAARALLREATP